MTKQVIIISGCISKLEQYSKWYQLSSRHKKRAKLLIQQLKNFYNSGEYTLCCNIIYMQLILHQQQLPDQKRPLEHLYGLNSLGKPQLDQKLTRMVKSKDRLYSILINTYKDLLKLETYHNINTKPCYGIHWVWLGYQLTSSDIYRIKACKKHFRRLYPNKNLTFHLWTNNPALVFPDSEINIENIAIFAHRSIYARVQVFLRYREYAFASDIVRLLILERYGGLYLDVSWGAPMLTDLSTSQNIFDLGEHAISLMEYSNEKLNILRHNIVSDKSMHYNSVIGQHRFNMENELFYVKVYSGSNI